MIPRYDADGVDDLLYSTFNGELIVMSRNDSTIHRYDPESLAHLGSFSVGSGSGQGVATDGELLYASLWTGGSVTIKVFNGAYSLVDSFSKPSGMSENNLIDMAYEKHTGTWFGIVTTGEGGTGTSSNTVIEFTMGGAVTDSHSLPWRVNSIGVAGCD